MVVLDSLLDVHECLHRIVQSFHESRVVNRRFGSGKLAGEALVPVGEDVGVLVSLPRLENVGHVDVVAVVAGLDQVVDKLRLEVDLLEAVFALFQP